MTGLIRWSVTAYSRLLILYPEDLRRDFGPEMLEAFSHDLTNACGMRGAVRVWRIALHELIHIGFPALLQVPAVAVPALSAAAFLVSESPLLIATIRRQAELSLRPGDATPLSALFALAILAAITALTSFVAVYPWKRTNLISLNLG